MYIILYKSQYDYIFKFGCYTAGFGLLPFLWAVNAIWFSREAFVVPPYEQQKQIKQC